MAIKLRTPTEDDLPELVAVDSRNFGVPTSQTLIDRAKEILDLDRFVVAVDNGNIVAVAGSFGLELTVPGHLRDRTNRASTDPAEGKGPGESEGEGEGQSESESEGQRSAGGRDQTAMLPMAGVAWVSVLASHVRQGILRRLMADLDERALAADEPVLGLMATESGIYERFGYGPSTRNRVVQIDRRRAQLNKMWRPAPGSVRLVDPADHLDELIELFDRYRRTQVGEVSRSEAYFRNELLPPSEPKPFAALHRDGYALWSIKPEWNAGHPAHELWVEDFVAATDEAHAALWHTILSVDLVGPVRSYHAVTDDDQLPSLLTDMRAVRTVEANDFLWLKVADVARCFSTRGYRADDRLVVGVVATPDDLSPVGADGAGSFVGRRFAVSPEGAEETDEAADLVLCRSAVGPLLLGGVSASQLVRWRRLRASPHVMARADVLFGTGIQPHCRTPY